jgi:N-acetylmuramoyl-L-alanine amidase
MTRRTYQSSSRSRTSLDRAGQTGRPVLNGSWLIVAIAAGVVGVLLLFVLSGASAGRQFTVDGEPAPALLAQGSGTAPPGAASPDTIVPATATARPTIARPTGPYVAIVAGHWGNDSGAVCPDGVTEQNVNLEIAKKVTARLRARGVWVDLLQEFDPRLEGFQADVLVSIHADSCDPVYADPPATGFKVARSQASQIPTITDKLVDCLHTEYQAATGMVFHENSITRDMTSYHSFREIDPGTPAAIVETGFLHLDYDMIVKQPDRPAEGIANGIFCFLKNQL